MKNEVSGQHVDLYDVLISRPSLTRQWEWRKRTNQTAKLAFYLLSLNWKTAEMKSTTIYVTLIPIDSRGRESNCCSNEFDIVIV